MSELNKHIFQSWRNYLASVVRAHKDAQGTCLKPSQHNMFWTSWWTHHRINREAGNWWHVELPAHNSNCHYDHYSNFGLHQLLTSCHAQPIRIFVSGRALPDWRSFSQATSRRCSWRQGWVQVFHTRHPNHKYIFLFAMIVNGINTWCKHTLDIWIMVASLLQDWGRKGPRSLHCDALTLQVRFATSSNSAQATAANSSAKRLWRDGY